MGVFHCYVCLPECKYFFANPKIGEMIHFDNRIFFQLAWFNHQPVFVSKDWFPTQMISATENTTDLTPHKVAF